MSPGSLNRGNPLNRYRIKPIIIKMTPIIIKILAIFSLFYNYKKKERKKKLFFKVNFNNP